MRVIKSLLLVVLTLALMAAGALLPYGAAVAQDRRLESGGEMWTLNDVQILIQQDMSAAQVLSLLEGEYTRVEWDSETNLTEKEAAANVYYWTELMVLEKLLPESAIEFENVDAYTFLEERITTASPFLAISGENREALLLWECTWESAEGGAVYTMWIDDVDGTMYGVNWTVNGFYDVATARELKYLYQYMDQWTFFLRYYYDCEITDTEIRTHEVSGNEICDAFVLTLEFQETENTVSTCTVQLKFQGGGFSFLC